MFPVQTHSTAPVRARCVRLSRDSRCGCLDGGEVNEKIKTLNGLLSQTDKVSFVATPHVKCWGKIVINEVAKHVD